MHFIPLTPSIASCTLSCQHVCRRSVRTSLKLSGSEPIIPIKKQEVEKRTFSKRTHIKRTKTSQPTVKKNHPQMTGREGVPAGPPRLSLVTPPRPTPPRREAASASLTSPSLWRPAWAQTRANYININKACCWGPPVRGCHRTETPPH